MPEPEPSFELRAYLREREKAASQRIMDSWERKKFGELNPPRQRMDYPVLDR